MLSIVIPTYNEEKYILKLLNCIKKNSFTNYEIIVADNKSNDRTKELAKKFNCRITNGGIPGVGRNQGAKIAKGNYLLFLDADVIFEDDFLNKFIEEFNNRKLDIATCVFSPISKNYYDRIIFKLVTIFFIITEKIYPQSLGFCIMVKKTLFDINQGFNEELRLGEDVEFVKRVSRKAKFGVIRSSKLQVSVRRMDKEGRFQMAIKTMGTAFSLLFNKRNKIKYNYEGYK